MITHAAPLPPDFYEKTLRNIANLRQAYEHNDTLHRFLGDAEAAIANLIVLEAEATTKFKEAAEYASTVQYERDTARGAVQALEATVNRLEVEIGQATRDLGGAHDTHSRLLETVRSALGAAPGQGVTWKARAVIRERDEARAERDRALADALEACTALDEAIKEREFARFHLASMEECFKVAQGKLAKLLVERDAAVLHAGKCALNAGHIAAGNHARKRLRDEIEEWRTRFDALATRAADLVKERDEARAALAEPFKVGDRVVNVAEGNTPATVIGFFDSIEGVRFVAVESPWDKPYCWRLDLCNPVKS